MTVKRRLLFLGTPAIAVAEWLLFELLRTPYRPPEDMATLLGTEKFDVFAFMVVTMGLWAAVVFWIFATDRWTLRDYLCFLALVACLTTWILFRVRYPGRPVTPWELLWS